MKRHTLAVLYVMAAARTTCETVVFAYLPIALYQQTGEQGLAMIALITAIPAVVRFFAAQGWGIAIDRAGRQKPFMVLGTGAQAVLLFALAASGSVAAVVVSISLGALLYSAYSPAARTLATLADEAGAMANKSPAKRILPRYLKLESMGWLIGGLAPGYLLDHTALTMRHLLLGACAVAALSAAAGALWLQDAPVPRGVPRPGAGQPVGSGSSGHRPRRAALAGTAESLLVLYRRPEFVALLLMLFFTFFAREAFFTTYGIYLTALGGSRTVYGASISFATFLGILMYDAAAGLAARWGSVRLVKATAAVYVLGYVLTVAWPNPWVLVAYFSLPLFPFLTMASAAAVTQMSAAGERGRGLGILEATDLLAVALGAVSAGSVAARLGLWAVPALSLSVGGAGLVASSLFDLVTRRRLSRAAAGPR